MSTFTVQKAKNLVDTNCVSDDSYEVMSSHGTPYLISNETCPCVGFKFREECSHILAVNIHKSISENDTGETL